MKNDIIEYSTHHKLNDIIKWLHKNIGSYDLGWRWDNSTPDNNNVCIDDEKNAVIFALLWK